jgi:hypothetical protein
MPASFVRQYSTDSPCPPGGKSGDSSGQVHKTRLNEIWIDDSGILHIKMKAGEVDLEEAMACFDIYAKLGCAEKKVLQIMDARDGFSVTREARDYSAHEGKKYFIASAIISKSLAVRIIVNFFNRFYRQPVPFKLFEDKEEALEWLKKFKS